MASTTWPPVKPPGAADDEHDARALVGEGGLGAREGEAVVGGADDQGALHEPPTVERAEHRPDPLVEDRTLALKAAMSALVSSVSAMPGGGRE